MSRPVESVGGQPPKPDSPRPVGSEPDHSDGEPAISAGRRLTVLTTRGGDGLGLSFKVEGSGRVFRLEPARDPHEPRFWCFRVYRCTSAGVVSQTERAWWGSGGMTRAELPAAVQAIRTNPNAWLADEDLAELREWIMDMSDEPAAPRLEMLRGAKLSKSSAPGRSN